MVPWRNSVRKRAALAPAAFIDPCLSSRAERAPAADGWVHEIKHDGFRLQIHARGKRVGLYTMTGVDWTARYPWIVEDVARLNVQHAIIDAECCCDGDGGVTDFERLMAACTMHQPTLTPSICWRSTMTTCAASRSSNAKPRSLNCYARPSPASATANI